MSWNRRFGNRFIRLMSGLVLLCLGAEDMVRTAQAQESLNPARLKRAEKAWHDDNAKQFLAAVQRLLTEDPKVLGELDSELQRRGVAPLGEALLIARSNAGVDHLLELRPSYLESLELAKASTQVVRELLQSEIVQELISRHDQELERLQQFGDEFKQLHTAGGLLLQAEGCLNFVRKALSTASANADERATLNEESRQLLTLGQELTKLQRQVESRSKTTCRATSACGPHLGK